MKTFDCPKCGGPVSYQQDVIGANLTARCPYCGSSLSVPDEMRGRPAQIISQVSIDMRGTRSSGGKWLLVVLLVPVVFILIGILAMAGVLVPLFRSPARPALAPVGAPPLMPKGSGKETGNGFVTETLKFGSEGIGAGMFKDARNIAVDGSGKIYVGDYTGGRVQVFDGDGKFITQWMVDPKMPLTGFAADRSGTVYIVQSGVITRHEGATGKLLGELPYSEGWGFDDLAIAADGGLVAAWYKNRDDIVRFSPDGHALRTIHGAISSVTDDSELDTHVAVDGVGNIYALGTFNNAVFKFSPDGKFLTRFGSDGDQPGQFRAPSSIAVDGKGRVYVGDFKGVQVFDGNGRYLTVFSPVGAVSGMVFNDKNELLIAARNHVVKYVVSQN
jgi:DNA-binding beta-propeller fold protein YncE